MNKPAIANIASEAGSGTSSVILSMSVGRPSDTPIMLAAV